MKIDKYTFGVGDRFGMQGRAQLKAVMMASELGIEIAPVWNKSNREHQIVKSEPGMVLTEAENAVNELGYKGNWYVDADHINLGNVSPFIQHSNFFTIDVADMIGQKAPDNEAGAMVDKLSDFSGNLGIPGIDQAMKVDLEEIRRIVGKFYTAVKEAAKIYNHIYNARSEKPFIPEISMDEVDEAQTPAELFYILLMVDHFSIPVQTIAPKFTGRFNKGVDYQGDIDQFKREFEEDLMVTSHITSITDLPSNLKLSIHSGSDKFSIYPIMGELMRKHDSGIHVKTAGTTWLEEVIGLSMAGGKALELAKRIYAEAHNRMEELCGPYATVIDIEPEKLPVPDEVSTWNSDKFSAVLRHIPGNPDYDAMFRQLVHVGYKVAAELGDVYTSMVSAHSDLIGEQVTTNIYERHIKRMFS